MGLSRSAVLLLLIFLLAVCFQCASAEDQLDVGEKRLAEQTLVSDGGAFTLGFFSPDDDNPARRYLGIWYSNPGSRTVVWVANRDAPAAGAPMLALANDSSLVMSDADGRVLWNTSGVGSSSSQTAPAELGNDGNLLIQLPDGTVVWQSFDHPTDTFLPEMKVRVSHRTGKATDRVLEIPRRPGAGALLLRPGPRHVAAAAHVKRHAPLLAQPRLEGLSSKLSLCSCSCCRNLLMKSSALSSTYAASGGPMSGRLTSVSTAGAHSACCISRAGAGTGARSGLLTSVVTTETLS
ncbi:putative serine/threonine-protein kinase receptor [Hordeum vulgare]|nr:putative serine/threonine-protein kinase receptor [Hordeum vulgare]